MDTVGVQVYFIHMMLLNAAKCFKFAILLTRSRTSVSRLSQTASLVPQRNGLHPELLAKHQKLSSYVYGKKIKRS